MRWSFYKQKFPTLSFYAKPILSGILIGTGYIPFPPIGMCIAYVPLWLFIFQQQKLKQVLIGTWICQFLTTLIGFNWLAYTIHSFGQMPWAVSLLGLLIFCSFSNLFMVFAGGVWFFLSRHLTSSRQMVLKLILFPMLFSLFHSLIPQLFPWNLGYAWMMGFLIKLPVLQTAEIWGFRFLSTLFYIFNLFFLVLYRHKWDKIGRMALAGATILFLFLNGFGFYLKKRISPYQNTLKTILVQHNIGQLKNLKKTKKFVDASEQSYATLKHLTYRSLVRYRRFYKKRENIDFVLWPEGAYPYRILKNQSLAEPLSQFISQLKIPLLTGGTSQEGRSYSNSLFVFNRKGELMKPVYDKVKLVAFGEYLPLADRWPSIKKLFPYFFGRFARGTAPLVIPLEDKKIGLQICYESLFDHFTRLLALNEAQILVNVTNDSWYGQWQQPWQHLLMSLARSIELRRPYLRATNTGFSTVIQSDGTVTHISPLHKPWSSYYVIPYDKNPPRTLFMTWGFYINEIFLFLLLIFGFLYSRIRA